ncbi:MAG TPA: TetR/AcrR family transcriptional regulator [Polyangiaceae bacterium]|jgi:AcrR family transcriptional regulator
MPRRARTAPRRAPLQKRAEDTVDVLLQATELAISRHGFHATTTNRIAELAGVSIGTLYHYFPTKEALVQAVVHRMWREEFEAMAANAGLLETAPLDVAVREIVGALVAVITKRRDLVMRWYSEASHLGDLRTGLDMSDSATTLVEAALSRRRDEVRPRDLHFAADLVVKTALAVARTASRDYPDQLADGALAHELAEMLSRYLLKDPPA